ncbi:MAG: hypothetical protein M1434_04395 [Chloroflexi bacterium]|nr:hypothetical protein [Chloroflexota bacterium]MCL5273973.1 hypothetical protein [Chloroflexota bacterium]
MLSGISDVNNESRTTLIDVLHQRQQKLLSLMPKYARTIINLAIIGFVLFFTAQIVSELSSQELPLSFKSLITFLGDEFKKTFAISGLSLGSAISAILSIFSNIVMWAFVIWSLSFVPYLAYHSYMLSRETKSSLTTRPLKWVQLFASTFLPIAAFAIAWNSTTNHSSNIVVQVKSIDEAAVLVVGTIIITAALFLINRVVPANVIAIRLALLSSLIYASVFLAYGQGYSVASMAALFGILFYLMFASGQIEEVGRRVVVYDLDDSVAKKLDVLNARFEQLRVTQDETSLSQHETEVLQAQAKTKSKLVESQVEQRLSQQLSEIQSKKIDLVEKMNQTQIDILQQKINMLAKVFDVASNEFSAKLDQEFPQQLDQLREKAKNLPPDELYAKMEELIRNMNPILDGLPGTLTGLRAQLLKAANELETQTRLLIVGSNDKNERALPDGYDTHTSENPNVKKSRNKSDKGAQ